MREEIRARMAEALEAGLAEGLTPDDLVIAGQIAEAVLDGSITEDQALQMLKAYSENESILEVDPDEFAERVQEYTDITTKVKAALLEAGEPGIADAIQGIRVGDGGLKGQKPMMVSPPVAFSCKAWFAIDRLTNQEKQTLWRAVHLAAQSEGLWDAS